MVFLYFLLTTILILASLILTVVHLGFRAPRNREKGNPGDIGMDFIQVEIPAISGKKLSGWLLAVENSTESIVIIHGWGGNAELMIPIAAPFYRSGINVLLVDARNHGNSESDSFSSMPRFAEDLGFSINWLKLHYPDRVNKIALLGHSVGAAAALLEASNRSDIDAVISVSAFAHPECMMRRYLKKLHIPGLIIQLIFRYIEWVIGHKFYAIAPLNTVCKISCPILLIHGKNDSTVPIEDARAILKQCPGSLISLLEIEGAGHDSVDQIEKHSHKLINFLSTSGFVAEYQPVYVNAVSKL